MDKTTKNESRISIILSAGNLENNFSTFESLFSSISKSKSDLECVIVDPAEGDKNTAKLQADRSFADLQAKGRARVVKANGSLGALYAAGLNEAEGAISLLVENAAQVNIASLASWVSANKKSIRNQEFFVGSYGVKNAANKAPARPWTEKLYNSAIRFLTPLNLRDHNAGVLAVRTEGAVTAFGNQLAAGRNHLEILHLAACSDITLNESALGADKKTASKGLGDILLAPFTAIALRWRYFVPGALHEMKAKPSLVSSNHPLYRLIFFALVILATVMMPLLSRDFGMTWDEKQHNEYSQVAYTWFASFGEDTAAIVESKSNSDYIRQAYRYYGEQSNIVAAIIYNVFDLPVFETRHFIISLYGLLGLICIGMAAKELGGWRAGIIGVLFTFFNPGWLGNSMNNPTDIPFATGFAFSLYFFIKVLKGLPKPKPAHLVWLGIGIGIGIASRVGAFLLIAYLALFLGVNWLSKFRDKDIKPGKLILPYAKIFLTVAVLGYIFGILLWPYALISPFKNPFVAFAKASDNTSFYTNNTELFDGMRLFMREQAPWYYVIRFLSIGNPVYLLLGLFIPVALFKWMKERIHYGFIVLLLFMVIFPVAYAEYANLNYYNGWRHYLFVLPGWIVLSAVSFEFLIGNKNNIVRYASLVVLLVLFAKPTAWIIKNHPNEYVYFNEIAGGMKGAYGKYELDYYSNSCREAGEWIARQEPNKKVLVAINNEPLTASYYAQQINPKMEFMWVREYEEYRPEWDYLILTTRTFSGKELLNGSFPPKGTVYTVDVDGVPIAAVVKRENDYMPMGYRTMREQKLDSAIYYFGKAAEWDPKNEETHRMLGLVLLQSNRFAESEKELDKAIEIYPENFSAYSNKALLYFTQRNYNKCIEFAEMAVKFKENVTESYYYAALSYLNLNQPYPAIDKLEKALMHGGQIPEFYYYLGKAYDAINNPEKSAAAYEACLSLNKNFVQAWADLSRAYSELGMEQQAQAAMQQYQQAGGR